MSKCEIKIDKSGSSAKITMSGVIDEDLDFSAYSLEGLGELSVYLGSVKSINSCGIREWIKWFGGAKNATIQFFECPKIIVDQINMVQGFLPSNAKVMSFYVPYYNDDSGSEKEVLFTYGKEYSDNELKLPTDIKDDDGNEMEVDVVEAKYFRFIKSA